MILNSLVLSFFAVAPLAAMAASLHGAVNHTRHTDVAKRQAGRIELQKRVSGSKWSFYRTGLGACGGVNKDSDFIVALNADEFGSGYPGPHCGDRIEMSFGGKTTTATITDRCPGCPRGGLDLSPGLFRFFAAESAGIIFGEWHYIDGSGAPPPPPPPPSKPPVEPPKPTTTWKPEPTTTWKSEPSTTWTPKIQSSSVAPSSSIVQSSASSVSSSASAASSAVPSAAPSSPSENLPALDGFLLRMGRMAVSAAKN